MQRALHRHCLHANAELPQVFRELPDADAVGASAKPHVCRATGAQHVSAVEGPGCLDVDDPQAEVTHGALHAGSLPATLRGTGACDDGEVALHDDRVLDEDGVGVLVGGLDLDDPPPGIGEGTGIRLPLRAGQVEVDRGAVDVGDDAVGQEWAGTADEGDR